MRTLTFDPLLPLALWLTLAVAGAALLAWYGWNRPPGLPWRRWGVIVGLMSLGLVLVLAILLNPTWIEAVPPPAGKPLLTVLVDASASMATRDGDGKKSRFQDAVELARTTADRQGDRFEVRVATFGESLHPVSPEALAATTPQEALTDLAGTLAAALQEDRPQGQSILLLSDGIHNGGGGAPRVLESVRLARALACPIYPRTFGGDADVQDLAVELPVPQELAHAGQQVTFRAQVRQRGLPGGRTTLVLSRDGAEIERRPVTLPVTGPAEVRFQVGPEKPGVHRFEVRAEPLPGEASKANNAATLLLRVVDKPVRILVLEGRPYWDGKFLMRTLLADASIELDSVVRLGPSRFMRRTLTRTGAEAQEDWKVVPDFASLLADGDLLRTYQIVVLGRDADEFLTDAVLARLRIWLAQDGGCLTCYRGQPTTQVNQRLGQLLPVRWTPARESRFHVRLTDRGRDLHWFPAAVPGSESDGLAALPTLATAARPEPPRPLAIVLATTQGQNAPDEPVLTYQPYGSGKVVVLEGAGMWRWAFLPPQQQEQDEVYRTLWHNLIRWLVTSGDLLPGQKMALRTDKIRFGTTEPAGATLLLREEAAKGPPPAIELLGDAGAEKHTVSPIPLGEEPGTYRVTFGVLPEGRYQARVTGSADTDAAARIAFDVRSSSEETLDLKARPDLMARIAQDSGGTVLDGDPGAALAQFQEHLRKSRPQQYRREAAWDRWWVLLAVFAVWGTAWGLRRSGGLV